jgi:hypothetical protein
MLVDRLGFLGVSLTLNPGPPECKSGIPSGAYLTRLNYRLLTRATSSWRGFPTDFRSKAFDSMYVFICSAGVLEWKMKIGQISYNPSGLRPSMKRMPTLHGQFSPAAQLHPCLVEMVINGI